ncbi:MAG: OOP family OmpA-OmpF porin [Cyclobacteriaceae bacterium]|jgi:OOP family OmpA-OmpF porin
MRIFLLSVLTYLSQLQSFAQVTDLIQFYGESEALDSINTVYDEGYIAIHPSGQEMLFTTKGHVSNVGGVSNPGDIWVAEYKSENWMNRKPSTNVQPSQFNSPIGFVNQGKLVLYNATYFDRGVYRGEIWLGDYAQGSISNGRKLSIPYFNNISEHQTGSISANGQHIVLAMESTSSFGVEDLYVMHLQADGNWSAPKNMGYRLNTAFQEYTPFLASDNETLFFSSNGRDEGEGSFDIYVTSRVDDTWQNWTEPKNIGPLVNTVGAETSFMLDPGGDFAYYASTTDSDGYGDLRRIPITTDILEDTSSLQVFEVLEEEQLYNRSFTLTNQESGDTIQGDIRLTYDGQVVTLRVPGSIDFEEVTDVKVLAKSAGYLSKELVISASDLSSTDTFQITLEPLDLGLTIQLSNVLFYQGTANFVEGSEKELDLVIEMLNENPTIKIQLAGHTDNVGDPALNLQLSNERVTVVKNYLIKAEVDFKRLTGKGFGGNQPLVPNTSESNRKLNRRVEFTITEN